MKSFFLITLLFVCYSEIYPQINDSRDVFLNNILKANNDIREIKIDDVTFIYIIGDKKSDPIYRYFFYNNICIQEIKSFNKEMFDTVYSTLMFEYGVGTTKDNFIYWIIKENGLDIYRSVSLEQDTFLSKMVCNQYMVNLNYFDELLGIVKKLSSPYTQHKEKILKKSNR